MRAEESDLRLVGVTVRWRHAATRQTRMQASSAGTHGRPRCHRTTDAGVLRIASTTNSRGPRTSRPTNLSQRRPSSFSPT
jgi:hypothetical protein